MMDQTEASRYAGRINREAINAGFFIAQVGVSLREIDAAVETYIVRFGCKPIFKGYKSFPNTCCLSPNDVVVHGVPSHYTLKDGDVLTIDVGCSYEGWCVDSAETRVIGAGYYPRQEHLIGATKYVLEAQIATIKDGVSLLEIMKASEHAAKSLGVHLFHQFGGHAIGKELHQEPFIPNAIDPNLSKLKRQLLEKEYGDYKLKTGQIICLEPVTTIAKTDIILDDDKWTVRTKDGSIVAHEEHCLLIKEKGYEIIS